MKYNFVCKDCKNEKIVNIPMGDDLPKLNCEKCNKPMYQNLNNKLNGLKISLDCQATSEYKPKNYNIGGSMDLEAYRDDL